MWCIALWLICALIAIFMLWVNYEEGVSLSEVFVCFLIGPVAAWCMCLLVLLEKGGDIIVLKGRKNK